MKKESKIIIGSISFLISFVAFSAYAATKFFEILQYKSIDKHQAEVFLFIWIFTLVSTIVSIVSYIYNTKFKNKVFDKTEEIY